MIIPKNLDEKSSFNFLSKIWALPLIPDKGFFTSWAKVLARFAAIFWVEKVFVESIILLRLSTHNISNIKQSNSQLHETVISITLLVFAAVVSSKSLFVLAPSLLIVFFNKLIRGPLVFSENCWVIRLFLLFAFNTHPLLRAESLSHIIFRFLSKIIISEARLLTVSYTHLRAHETS